MKSRTGRKLDLNQLAKAIVDETTGEAPKTVLATAKQRAGRAGGFKGGKKRMEALTPEQRLQLSAQGIAARKRTPADPQTTGVVRSTRSGQ